MKLTKLAISRPVFMLMLMCLAILMGAIGYNSMRVEQNPEVNFGVITVTTVYPGADPDTVSVLVTRKVEEALSGVGGIREVTSQSQEGVSAVVAQFEIGTNMDQALNDARAKVDAIVNQLPSAVEKPTISKFDSASLPVLTMVLRHPTMTGAQLRDLADDRLVDLFSRIPGVAQVSVTGGGIREIQVQIDRNSLLQYQIGIADVVRSIQGATLNIPSGRVVTDDKELTVRVPAEFQSAEELRDFRLSLRDNSGAPRRPTSVRLGDIATVVDSTEETRIRSRLNQSDAVVMVVQKTREGNAIEISKGAEAVIAQINKDFGVEVVKTDEAATRVKESIKDLNIALFFGIFLVTLIVYVFLHNFRGTLIVGIAIPICLSIAAFVIWSLGFTINSMTMLAMALAIGVLIDDAIVILENIYRHLKMGEDPVTAAINGRSEIGVAAIAITLADVAVFIPIAFMGGVVGQFFRPLGITFAVAVLSSLLVSFTITPMLASRWYRRGEDLERPTGRFAIWFERGFTRFENLYRRMLAWSLEHRWFVFCAGYSALVGVFIMIAGSAQSSIGGVIGLGVACIVFTAALATMIFGGRVWAIKLGARKAWLMFFGLAIAVGAVVSLVPGLAPSLRVPLPVVAILGALIVMGVLALIANIAQPVAKGRFVLSGAMFGVAFLAFALIGFGWGQWKGEPLFKFQFFPISDGGKVDIKVLLPPGSTLDQTAAVVALIEERVKAHPETTFVVSKIGQRQGDFFGSDIGPNYADVTVTLREKRALLDTLMFWTPQDLRVRKDTAVAADMLKMIGRVPGAEITVSGGDTGGFGRPIQMGFTSDDRELLIQTAERIRDRLAQGAVPGVLSPEISAKSGRPELQVIPRRDRMADVGVSAFQVASTARTLYSGDDSTKFRVQGREYAIRVMLSLEDRNNPAILAQVPITFESGNPIFLGEVATIQPGTGVDRIERRNRAEEVRITADLATGLAAGNVQAQINDLIEEEKLVPEGVAIRELGQADVQNREAGFLFGALLLGLVLVYMVLASLYDNLLYPFIIQLSQPQAMVGALLALMLTDNALNIVGFIGIICLVGLVGKNAILLVDYTNTLRSRGRNRMQALLEAGAVRLRPIMMTTLALILGMLPIALAVGRGSEFRETLGITIVGGITLSTMLTLLVIPCSYTIFDDLSNWFARKMGRPHSDERFQVGAAPDEVEGAETAPVTTG